MARLYRYVGPEAVKARIAVGRPIGERVGSAADIAAWARRGGQGRDGLVAATFVIDATGDLLVADRRSEHVACAGGSAVLSAGELFLHVAEDAVEVAEASNRPRSQAPCERPYGSLP
jgi:hypothetical protein